MRIISELTALEARAMITAFVCVALVAIAITIAVWHHSLRELPDIYAYKKQQAETEAAQREKDMAAEAAVKEAASKRSHEQWMRDKELEQAEDVARHQLEIEELRVKSARAYDDAMRDIATKYALYCPGCGKVMTLQHANRLPADAQAQIGYIPPPIEEETEEPKGRNKRR